MYSRSLTKWSNRARLLHCISVANGTERTCLAQGRSACVGKADIRNRAEKVANDPRQTLLPRRTGILPFRFRLPLTRQVLRFGDLCRSHLLRDLFSIDDRILVTSRSRHAEPHVC